MSDGAVPAVTRVAQRPHVLGLERMALAGGNERGAVEREVVGDCREPAADSAMPATGIGAQAPRTLAQHSTAHGPAVATGGVTRGWTGRCGLRGAGHGPPRDDGSHASSTHTHR